MPQLLKYVGQLAMDSYFQNYKGETDFWELEDFVRMCGNVISSMYYDFYKQQYGILRQDKKDEVVEFDAGWLLEQDADVKDGGAILPYPVMVFPYDQSSTGIQNVFSGSNFDQLERTSISALYQLNYVPKCNRAFWYSDVSITDGVLVNSRIGIKNLSDVQIKKIRVQYIPSMDNENALVPDGIIGDAISKTVLTLKQMATGEVVDKTNDSNANKVLQTELDKQTLIK